MDYETPNRTANSAKAQSVNTGNSRTQIRYIRRFKSRTDIQTNSK